MKRIFWITPASFWDVDLPIVKELQKFFYIDWHFFENYQSDKATRSLLELETTGLKNLSLHVHPWNGRRSIKGHLKMFKILIESKKTNPNLYYTSSYSFPCGFWAYKMLLNQKKVVYACHNVVTPKGASRYRRSKIETWIWLKTAKNVHVFSESQLNVLNEKHPGKNVFMARLAQKDYGEPTNSINKKELSEIRFLFFGIILPYKRVDLLIKAGEMLYVRGYRNFKILIAGNCPDFEQLYSPLIVHHELFELDIKRIPNEDVANLFGASHYFVMPYQDIAQSGAITVAFRYNVPVIASSIKQFDEFVHDRVDGYRFQTEQVDALADAMQYAMDSHDREYDNLVRKQKQFSSEALSLESIVYKYKSFFESL